jgi:Phosphorylated CTD interacting factor 1 WW domain
MSSIVEIELLRESLYQGILRSLYDLKMTGNNDKLIPSSKINFILLRYVFNKIADRGNEDDAKSSKPIDDPVFITRVSSLAVNQLKDDFEYFGIKKHTYESISDMIEKGFVEAVNSLQNQKIKIDSPVTLTGCNIVYGDKVYPDISSLGKNYPSHIKEALALQIRYKYMHLETYGLSNCYAKKGYKPSDKVVEGFASAFNHFFDAYCSAFPDLEACFGSRGSFFNADLSSDNLVFCNPPFDVSVMKCMITKVLNLLNKAVANNYDQSFKLTFPHWRDMKELAWLSRVEFCKEYSQIPKAKTEFVDSSSGKIISPCDILQVTLSHNKK